MKKSIVFIFIFFVIAATSFSVEVKNDSTDMAQMQKLQYEREKLHYGENYMVVSKLDNIQGTGKVSMKPEFFTMEFLLVTENSKLGSDNKDAKLKAYEENNKKIKEFKDYLISIGVKNEDIQTLQYDFTTNYGKISSSAGVSHCLRVKCDIKTNIGLIFSKIGASDILISKDIVYGVSEKTRKDATLKAYEIAVSDAMNQGKAIAESANCQLGDIYNIGKIRNLAIIPRNNYNMASNMQMNSTEDKRDPEYSENYAADAAPIAQKKELTVSENIYCSFDIIKKIK